MRRSPALATAGHSVGGEETETPRLLSQEVLVLVLQEAYLIVLPGLLTGHRAEQTLPRGSRQDRQHGGLAPHLERTLAPPSRLRGPRGLL